MKLFKNGGTCATPMTEIQKLIKRNQARINASKRSLGSRYILHPSNPQVDWRGGQ